MKNILNLYNHIKSYLIKIFKELNQPTIDRLGNIEYLHKNGKIHREDGLAIEFADGTKWWFINKKFHREDGPAVECHNGNKFWYIYGIEAEKITFK